MKRNTGSLSSSEANVTTGSDSRKRPFTLSAKNRMVVYERVWLGLPVKGGGVTGGPVKQVMSVKEGKGMFFFSVSVFSGSLAWLGKVLCKCSGNVLIGYFFLHITIPFLKNFSYLLHSCNCFYSPFLKRYRLEKGDIVPVMCSKKK